MWSISKLFILPLLCFSFVFPAQLLADDSDPERDRRVALALDYLARQQRRQG